MIDCSFRDSQPPKQLDRGKKASRRSGCRLHFVRQIFASSKISLGRILLHKCFAPSGRTANPDMLRREASALVPVPEIRLKVRTNNIEHAIVVIVD